MFEPCAGAHAEWPSVHVRTPVVHTCVSECLRVPAGSICAACLLPVLCPPCSGRPPTGEMREAEAPGTDQGASQDSVQSSTPMVSSKERRWCGVAPGLWGLGLQTLSLCSAVRMQGEIHQDLHDTIQDLNSKVLHQEIKQLEEALEQEEICQQQRKKEAEAPGTVLLEVVEAQLERDMLARRRGFIYWLQTLCLLLVGLQLAVGFALAAAVLYAAWYDPELFYRLLLRVLCEETYAHLAYALGEILPVVSEGLLPF
ncbi:uncharacterized protein LOC142077326 isoform X2 [Calonectris borealis]|uniref:uncharacterized protein LOC142077326 isoform X2 n=1 Tax=Calonectris borealis TaxID=1323832 RepID=UPI003F4C0B7A